MTVKELIGKLQKCNPNDIVMYNFENSFTNDDLVRAHGLKEPYDCEFDLSIDDVLIGSGTADGFVFLIEKLLTECEV